MMNVVDFLALRHTGFEPSPPIEIPIRRLKCNHKDVYQGIILNELESNPHSHSSIITCRFADNQAYPDFLALASDDGRVAVQNTSQRFPPNSSIKGVSAHHGNAIFDIAWMPDELKIVTASGDHTARLWDINNSRLTPISEFQSHTGSIKTVVFRPENKNIFATGARDGAIFVWDVRDRNKKPDNSIFNGHRLNSINSVKHRNTLVHASLAEGITGLIFQDSNTLISCAAGDGLIKIWDLRKNYAVRKNQSCSKHVLSYGGNKGRNGFSSLAICPAGLKLYVSCIDDVIYTYNLSSYDGKPVAKFHGHQNSSYYVKNCISPDGTHLMSGSSDGNGYIWRTDQPGAPVIRLQGHTQEVTSITWSKLVEPRIVTSSDDCSHRVWRVGLEHRDDNDEIEICGTAEAVDSVNESLHPNRVNRKYRMERWVGKTETTPPKDRTDRNLGTESVRTSIKSLSSSKRARDQMTTESEANEQFINVPSPIKENYQPLRKRLNTKNSESQPVFRPKCNTEFDSNRAGPCRLSANPDVQAPLLPTHNLPNFVADGTAPHLIRISPKKSKDRIDWLTRIRRTQYEQKLRKSESNEISDADVTSVRRNSRSQLSESRHTKGFGTSLLKFFKVESPPGKIRSECTK